MRPSRNPVWAVRWITRTIAQGWWLPSVSAGAYGGMIYVHMYLDSCSDAWVAYTGITLALSSQHPALHSLYTSIDHSPPVLLLNAGAAVAAAIGMAVGGNSLEVSVRP